MKEIKVIAPAFSAKKARKVDFSKAEENLKKLNLTVSYGKNIFNTSNLLVSNSASIENRINDWNDAWENENVAYILGYNGGTNSNQILDSIDWSLVKESKAYFIGYSDLTVLANAIYTKTNKISYLGINFAYLFRDTVLDYTLNNLEKSLNNTKYSVYPSNKVNMDMWSTPAVISESKGWWTIQAGMMKGKVIGGNLPSFRLLYGTQYMPNISKSVLFIEWDNYTKSDLLEFDRELESLTMQEGFNSVQGLIIGRFQKNSSISKEDLIRIIASKSKLKNIPVLANVDFGHTAPMFVFPIGGNVRVDEDQTSIKFSI